MRLETESRCHGNFPCELHSYAWLGIQKGLVPEADRKGRSSAASLDLSSSEFRLHGSLLGL